MRLKYDEAVTTLFRDQKKLWRLATGGALEGTYQAHQTPFFGKSWGSFDFQRYSLFACKLQASDHGGWLIELLTFVILQSQVIWMDKTQSERFWKKYYFSKISFGWFIKGFPYYLRIIEKICDLWFYVQSRSMSCKSTITSHYKLSLEVNEVIKKLQTQSHSGILVFNAFFLQMIEFHSKLV